MVFLCSVCHQDFDSIPSLCTHIRFIHTHSILSPYSCGNCTREYSTLKSLRVHLQNKHAEGNIGLGDENVDEYNGDVEIDNGMNVDVNADEGVVNENNGAQANNYPLITVFDFKQALFNSALALSAKLYSQCTLNRSQIQEIINMVSDFTTSGFLDVLKQKTLSVLGEINNEDMNFNELMEMFTALEDCFEGLLTERQRLNALEHNEAFIRPESYFIRAGEQVHYVDGEAILTPVEYNGQIISMKKGLKQFLELPGVLRDTFSNIDALKNSRSFTNIIQSSLWKDIEEKPQFQNKILLPLVLYYDDAEPDNQCGSHSGAHKLGCVYYQIPCIPQHLTSSLENIFVASVFLTNDRSQNNNFAFQPIVNELRNLETEGILVEADGNEYRIYFALALVLGDNLGIHTVSGFVESFSANYFCRVCKVHKNDSRNMFRENANLLRNIQNYQQDLLLNNYSLTGIKRECVWNALTSYHVIINIVLDMMHDFLEGVCHYDLAVVLLYLIRNGFFTLETLNERIQQFDYGFDSGNKPIIITAEHLQNEKLKMSAFEMYFFVRHLGLIIGDLVPENNEYWKLYIYLAEILDIVTSPAVRRNSSAYLAVLISEHHEIYCNVFEKTLKPKHHFMLHYPRVLDHVGPLIHLWCMRMEGKHRPFVKQSAKSHSSRKNLPLTTALRYSLSLSARVLAKRGFAKDVSFHSKECNIRELQNFDELQNSLPPGYENSIVVKEAEICGIIYSREMVVVINYENDLPLFAVIKGIVKPIDARLKPFLLLMGLHTVGFSGHKHCYLVRPTVEWFFVNYKDLISFYPTKCRTGPDGHSYVTFRHVL